MDRYAKLYLWRQREIDAYEDSLLLPCIVIRDHKRYRAVMSTMDRLVFMGDEIIKFVH